VAVLYDPELPQGTAIIDRGWWNWLLPGAVCLFGLMAGAAGLTISVAGVLVVTPYYSKPPQAGLYAHFTTVADATGLPVLLYDIPARSGVPIATETLIRLAQHERIVAVKDAKDDLAAASLVLAATDLAYYSGSDMFNLPLLSIGGVGFVSVVGHLAGMRLREMVDSYVAGEVARAAELHRGLLPLYEGIFRTQGVILVKAALALQRRAGGGVRLPLVPATPAQIEQLCTDLAAAGVACCAGGSA